MVSVAGEAPLAAALGRLDAVLERAVDLAAELYGALPGDRFRGLYVGRGDVESLLARPPGEPTIALGGGLATGEPALARLGERLGLDDFDLDLLLVALAPELDLRYELIYAYLQDDVTRRRATPDLALNLLCSDAHEKRVRRRRLGPGAPLLRLGLLEVGEADAQEPMLARALRPAAPVVRHLLGDCSLDPCLAGFCVDALPEAGPELLPVQPGLRIYVRCRDGRIARRAAASLAEHLGRSLLVAELQRAPDGDELEEALDALVLEARLRGAVVLLDDADGADPRARERAALLPPPVVLSGRGPCPTLGRPTGLVELVLTAPASSARRETWAAVAPDASPAVLDELAGRYELDDERIAAAAVAAGASASPTALFAAARAEARCDIGSLAQRVEPVYGWDDIVLPEDSLAHLHEICARVRHRERVLDAGGFARRHSLGHGVSVLFAGASGTGKTMAAEVLARDLELDLYRIDLSQVVDKYIGETEKRLAHVFEAAEGSAAILFFDEADALFGKRSETKDAHDRYANIEVAYLLQRIEAYAGVAVLTTNMRANVDAAFVRRLAFAVEFPPPDAALRFEIWRRIWPSETEVAGDVDLAALAEEVELPGGHIRAIATNAAFYAAAEGEPVAARHVAHAVRREYQKLGYVSEQEQAA